MADEKHTPTTDEVRREYMFAHPDSREARDQYGEAFDRWLVSLKADVVRSELLRLAELSDDMKAWTENNFLPGPNVVYAIKHHRDMSEWLREAADEYASEAHAPTDDEREALWTIIDRERRGWTRMGSGDSVALADAVLAWMRDQGFRRSETPEPSAEEHVEENEGETDD